MNPIPARQRRGLATRRGVTLVEMLVTVAMLVLMMMALVQVFQGATGALNSAQSYQELDNSLRRIDTLLRSDLDGITARLTPPLDPKENLGYFEYGENSFADLQGEDSDDYIRFTAKAPPGRPFRGRVFLKPPVNPSTGVMVDPSSMSADQLALYKSAQPVNITSECAEIIYFLRNGNLYRRVLLVAPERQSSIVPMVANVWPTAYSGFANPVEFQPGAFGGAATVSWQGVNDLSARPAKRGGTSTIVLNTLGDLTNRENRYAYPRFSDDYLPIGSPDGNPDDSNGDGIPDFHPTFYANGAGNLSPRLIDGLIQAPGYTAQPTGTNLSTMAFPYIYPGAYSQPETDASSSNRGWIHSPTPDQTTYPFISSTANAMLHLRRLNHNPLDIGDNLYRPESGNSTYQTWWGLPTSRETLSTNWMDPTVQPNLTNLTNPNLSVQPNGLNPRNPAAVVGGVLKAGTADDDELLPAMTSLYRSNPQTYTDGWGSNSSIYAGMSAFWDQVWEEDLIMTGVRSFDVKVLDDYFGGYVDLGWGDDLRITYTPDKIADTVNFQNLDRPYLNGLPVTANPYITVPAAFKWSGQVVDSMASFAHEGRMPPLLSDLRFDAQFGQNNYRLYRPGTSATSYAQGNLGDDSPDINRLRRVYDTWSTDYSRAPSHAIDVTTGPFAGQKIGPPMFPPIYPSYPAPYPAPLKGLQIQVRVADPTNQRVKQITIRQDFSDKL